MNVENVLIELKEKYPGKPIFENKGNSGTTTEIVCEVSQDENTSLAIAIIDQSPPHYHKKVVETYKIIKEALTLFVDNEQYTLSEGETFMIPINKNHYALGDETWVEVVSSPKWTPEDYILLS